MDKLIYIDHKHRLEIRKKMGQYRIYQHGEFVANFQTVEDAMSEFNRIINKKNGVKNEN